MFSIPPVARVVRLLTGLAVLLSLAICVAASHPALNHMYSHMISSGLTLLAGIGVVGVLLGLCGLLRRHEQMQHRAGAAAVPPRRASEDGDGTRRRLALPQPQPAEAGASARSAYPPPSHCDHEVPGDAHAIELFGQLKTEVACRNWRKAKATVQRLVDSCPNHPKAQAARAQRALIDENAEIEERKHIEQRIQQLLKHHRYGAGIQLAEKLIRQYPSSPQARAARQWLPRLRAQLAAMRVHAS